MPTPNVSRPRQMWSSVATSSAICTGLCSGSSTMPVSNRMSPVSGARRASTWNGWGQIVGCDTQCCGIVTAEKPLSRATWHISTSSSICS